MAEPLPSPTLFPIIFENRVYNCRLCCILQCSLMIMCSKVIPLPPNAIPYALSHTEDLPLVYTRAFSPHEELYQSRLARGAGVRSTGSMHCFISFKTRDMSCSECLLCETILTYQAHSQEFQT